MFTKNTNKTKLVAATLLALMTLGSSASVFADQRFSRNEVRQIAHRNGYELGLREGRFDSQRGGRFELRDSRVYVVGMAGYREDFGYERDYRDAFRDGFENGYRNGFNTFERHDGFRDHPFGWNRPWNRPFGLNRRGNGFWIGRRF